MADPVYMGTVVSYLGLAEKAGTVHEPKIVQFFADVGQGWITTDEDAWCAAFAGSVLKRHGYRIPAGVEAVRARGYGAPVAMKVDTPQYGDLVLIGKPGSITHVTFFDSMKDGRVRCIGGNQSNQVKYSNYQPTSIEGFYRPVRSAVERPMPPLTRPAPQSAPAASEPASASPAGTVATGGGLIAGAAIAAGSGGTGAGLWIGAAVFVIALVVGAVVIFRRRKE